MNTLDFASFYNRLYLCGVLCLGTALRVGVGKGGLEAGADLAVVKDARGAPYIPGSSFKGVLRSHVEAVLRTINSDYACLCVSERKGEDHGCLTTRDAQLLRQQIEALQRDIREKRRSPDALERFYFENSCRVCRVFGSPYLASKVMVSDLLLAGEWLGRYQLRDGIAIDRDTETASEGKLYSFEAVPPGTEFKCEIILENATPEEQGMVLLGLKAFEHGRLSLGGGRSRGLGKVSLTWDWNRSYEVDSSDKAALVDYLLTGKARLIAEAAVGEKIAAFRQSLGV